MINIVCWLWKPFNGAIHHRKNIFFTGEHVNRLNDMLKRNISLPYKLHCITDNPDDIHSDVNLIPLWSDNRDLGGCFVRLKSFSPMMETLIGEDFFSIDIDTVIVKDITNLLELTRKTCEFKIWSDTHYKTPYNGSFFYMKSGARKQVWEKFNPLTSPEERLKHGYVGTDQAWIACCLGENEATWDRTDGVYSYRVHMKQEGRFDLNGNEKIIFFHGSEDPSKRSTQSKSPWIADYWGNPINLDNYDSPRPRTVQNRPYYRRGSLSH